MRFVRYNQKKLCPVCGGAFGCVMRGARKRLLGAHNRPGSTEPCPGADTRWSECAWPVSIGTQIERRAAESSDG
jgi:hypothetical protein